MLTFNVEGLDWLPFEPMLVLYSRQKRLRSFQVDFHTVFDETMNFSPSTSERFRQIPMPLTKHVDAKQITTLHLCVDQPPSIVQSRKLLAVCRNVTRLDIDAKPRRASSKTKREPTRLQLLRPICDDILGYIFGHFDAIEYPSEWPIPREKKVYGGV